jgi:hypothetical protein
LLPPSLFELRRTSRRGACHRARVRDPVAPLRKRFAFVAGNDA